MSRLRAVEYEEVLVLKASMIYENMGLPQELTALLLLYHDVFPSDLPDGLPPERAVEHDVEIKSGAQPKVCPPFRLSPVEIEALESFVSQLLKKKWIERSVSPWISNIFAVPKRDLVTGKMPSRIEWVRGSDALYPVRWVIDYRFINSATNVPKIPIRLIDELFRRMHGAVVSQYSTWPPGIIRRASSGTRNRIQHFVFTTRSTHGASLRWAWLACQGRGLD
jgi:hypothetical protein